MNACGLVALTLAAVSSMANAAPVSDSFSPSPGSSPVAVSISGYKLPAKIDPEVATELPTELWATVYRPTDMGRRAHPLLMFLHGDYATCGHLVAGVGRVDDSIEYTFDGKCPAGYFPIQSQLGYGYAAKGLAARGYIVVSINANRGVNFAPPALGDAGLTLRRGRLVLRHLQAWSHWNHQRGIAPLSLGFDPVGRIDFSEVGLMGHSRGGEGVRAAVSQYQEKGSFWPLRLDPDFRFKAILEIAPVDGASSETINAQNLAWAVVLPLCDNSVPMLDGLRIFDRGMSALGEELPAVKATFAVAGTNHNFFNSVWRAERFQQPTDSAYPGGCVDQQPLFDSQATGSLTEQAIGWAVMDAFFRATVGSEKTPELLQLFDAAYPLPAWLARLTPIERGYSSSDSRQTILPIEDFTAPTGQNSNGPANLALNIDITHDYVPEHAVQGGWVSWNRVAGSAPNKAYFQTNWTGPGYGRSVRGFDTLTLRASLQCGPSLFSCSQISPLNDPSRPVNFSIALVTADGKLSDSVRAGDFAILVGPVGSLIVMLWSSIRPPGTRSLAQRAKNSPKYW